MLKRLKRRLQDMKTVFALCRAAETHALADGQEQPGSEHFLLAALDLPEGSARRAFARAGMEPEVLKPAISQQYLDALGEAGLHPGAAAAVLGVPDPLQRKRIPPRAKSSAIGLLERLSSREGLPRNTVLSGALIIASIARERHSVAARALRAARIDSGKLAEAALAEVAVSK